MTKRLFATTAVIAKQEAIEAEDMKYFPKKLQLDALAILAAPRNMKLINRTVRIFRPMNAMMFVWVSAANRGLTSIAPLPVMPINVVSRSVAPRRIRAEQVNACVLTMRFHFELFSYNM